MMPGRMGLLAGGSIADNQNPLGLSWQDSAWIPMLNTTNVMDYFSDRSNPFFDRTCNNEIVKMQRLAPEQLQNMTGLEYILLHVQEPILYVIRKQHRHGSQQVTPLADYYIIAGIVYQAPDLGSVINSRIHSTVQHLQSALEESLSYSRYHPSKGYWWDFKVASSSTMDVSKGKNNSVTTAPKDEHLRPQPQLQQRTREDASSLFQRQRVDMLLGELIKAFPLPMSDSAVPPPPPNIKPVTSGTQLVKLETTENASKSMDTTIKTEIKQEKIRPPPEKRPRLN